MGHVGIWMTSVPSLPRDLASPVWAPSPAPLGPQAAASGTANGSEDFFMATLAHDLAEPLRSISSLGTAMMEEYGPQLPGPAREKLARMGALAGRAHTMVSAIRRLSTRGWGRERREPVDVDVLVADVIDSLGPAVEAAGARVEVTAPLDAVTSDPSLLFEIFLNLVSNGLKFNLSAVPCVQIRSRRRHEDVEFEVDDNGIGLAPEYLERLFRGGGRFPTGAASQGTGLGQVIVRRCVQRLGGQVHAHPSPLGGLRVVFTLPGYPASDE